MIDPALKESFARDVCLLRYVGIQIVVVHGGGPQIDLMLEKMGIEARFSGGLRVTDEPTMEVVEMVLAGSINSDLVGLVCKHGGRAMGLSGRDDAFLRAAPMGETTKTDKNGSAVTVDLGRVGRISHVDATLVKNLISNGFIPIVAPVAIDRDGRALNINADTAAGRIAESLGAAKLILMTDVEGVKTKDGTLLSSLAAPQAAALVADGTISGGMIPKVECALEAVAGGVEKVHIIDGRRLHALLLEIFTDTGVGTEIQPRADR
jgi:acetylglutamate kinase